MHVHINNSSDLSAESGVMKRIGIGDLSMMRIVNRSHRVGFLKLQ